MRTFLIDFFSTMTRTWQAKGDKSMRLLTEQEKSQLSMDDAKAYVEWQFEVLSALAFDMQNNGRPGSSMVLHAAASLTVANHMPDEMLVEIGRGMALSSKAAIDDVRELKDGAVN